MHFPHFIAIFDYLFLIEHNQGKKLQRNVLKHSETGFVNSALKVKTVNFQTQNKCLNGEPFIFLLQNFLLHKI